MDAAEMVDQMKARLKDTLIDRKEFEIEFLALKKNYLNLKDKSKQLNEHSN
jgi:hypothetical protein